MNTDGYYIGDYRRDPSLTKARNGSHYICRTCGFLRLNRCQKPNKTLMRRDEVSAYCDGHEFDPLKAK